MELGPLIGGTASWVDGRYAWTDYVYDDHGANTDGRPGGDGAGGYTSGNENSADIVQVQLGVTSGGWSARFTLQTLVDVARPVAGLALDTDADPATGAATVPGGSWPASGALGIDALIVQRGAQASVSRYVDGAWEAVAELPAAVDLARNTIDIDVPATLLDARQRTWRVFALAGYADESGASWPEGRAIMDLAFVGNERPYLLQTTAQADVLAGLLPSARAAATIDFDRAERRDTELAQAPRGALSTFLHHSRLRTPEGVSTGATGPIGGMEYLGPYQPYLVWLPDPMPSPAPLLVYLHGSAQNHLGDTWVNPGGWPYHGLSPALVGGYSGNNKVVGVDPEDVYLPSDGAVGSLVKLDRGFSPYAAPGVVILPLGRMNSSGYRGIFEADVFEALEDIARRVPIDRERISLSGSSMGGIGTLRLGVLYPDVWSHVFPIIGSATSILAPGDAFLDLLGNLGNVPVRMQNGLLDPLIQVTGALQTANALIGVGRDFRFWLLETREHESVFALNHCVRDQAFATVRDAQPAQVDFLLRRDLVDENPDAGYAHRYDRAYWISGIRLHPDADSASVRATDLTRADRLPKATPVFAQQQNLVAGRDVCGPNAAVRTMDTWTERGVSLSPGPAQERIDAIDLRMTGVASLTIDIRGTGVAHSPAFDLVVEADRAARLTIVGPGGHRELTVEAGARTYRVNR